MPSASGKGNQHLHKACKHTEAQSALKSPVDGCLDSELDKNTVEQNQHCIAGVGLLCFIKFRVNTTIYPGVL